MKHHNKFLYTDINKRFHTYDYFLRTKFGQKCVKIPLDCGFTCPNIDGTKGHGGCTYCSGIFNNTTKLSVKKQFETARETLNKKWANTKYIPYFQAFTNTYAPLSELKPLYEEALGLPDVVGINIATRADCLSDEIIDYLNELAQRTFLTVELGLQTIHDQTAEKINRCHTYDEFSDCFSKLKKFPAINTCVHIINGLPGENKEMMVQTARTLAELHPNCVKIHLLHILKNTVMAEQYLNGEFDVLSLEEYVDIVTSQLQVLPADIYIGRITGDGMKDDLIAPLWSLKKFVVMNEIDKKLVESDTYQGVFV